MTDSARPVVLAVDDQPNVAEAYAMHLSGDYEVRTANGGEAALDALDDAVDVVLLDRRMPGRSGDEVLDEIRARGVDAQVAMVTAVDPEFDILEMPFDAYLTKPVTREELVETVDRLVQIAALDDLVRERFRLAQKRAALRAEKIESQLRDHEAYQALVERLSELEDRAERAAAEMDRDSFEAAFRDLDADAVGGR